MTNDQFENLVGRLEGEARLHPKGYRGKVFLLALLGNAYLGAILLLTGALFLTLLASVTVLKALALKLALVVGFFLWMVLKALWVKIEPPQGQAISAARAPALFALIDELRLKLGAPPFHHVLVTDEFNAGVVQSPRLGIFGWHRNYLLIGLPLMKSLSIEQFKAVLAHEFGHLAKGHGRLSNWIYRQRLRWSRLMAVLESNESSGTFLFKPFLNWFAPYFNAFSFPLARANEYEADAISVRLTSSGAAAQALTSVNVVGSYLNECYWPQIHSHADDHPQPGFAPYGSMRVELIAELDDGSLQKWMEQAMARQTTHADTHPALKERLLAIGEAPQLALPMAGAAADALLGGALQPITETLDQRWQNSVLPAWEQRHCEVQEGRKALVELNARYESGSELSVDDAYRRALFTHSVGRDADAAIDQLRALNTRAPDNAPVCFALGARLLARDDETGCALLERAMQLDEGATHPSCELLFDYHWRHGHEQDAGKWRDRLVEEIALQGSADKERSRIQVKDKLEPHGLSEEVVMRLREQLRQVPELRKAWFVKKSIQHLVHRPCYVLGYKVTGFFRLHSKQRAAEAMRCIQDKVHFPGETLILNVEGDYQQFGRKFRRIRGAQII